MSTEQLKTSKDAARYFNLPYKYSHKSIEKWAREGKLKGIKIGDYWRFRQEDLEAFTFVNK